MKTIPVAFTLLAAACTQETATTPANEPAPAESEPPRKRNEELLNPPVPGDPGGLPDDRAPVRDGPIDPKSGQGAGQVVQSYFSLVESGRLAEANELWSVGVERLDLAGFREVHANIGAPGKVEGGAGSLYVEIPVQLYGRLKDGKPFNSRGIMTLRRVNDVPGSTEKQRRWHILNAEFSNVH